MGSLRIDVENAMSGTSSAVAPSPPKPAAIAWAERVLRDELELVDTLSRRPDAEILLARSRALDALRIMRRDGVSLGAAAKQARTTPTTTLRYAASALARDKSGRYRPTEHDRTFVRNRQCQ